jgi:transposase
MINERAARMQLKRVAIDTSKHVFTLHGVDDREHPVLRRDLKRGQVEAFFAKLPATEVVGRPWSQGPADPPAIREALRQA